MLFQPHLGQAKTVLLAFDKLVSEVIASVIGFPHQGQTELRNGALIYEHDFPRSKCVLSIELHLVDAAEGGHLDVVLKPFRIVTGRGRRQFATIMLRGKPDPAGLMVWTSSVERQKDTTPEISHFIRLFHGTKRKKDLDTSALLANERIAMLVRYAVYGKKSL